MVAGGVWNNPNDTDPLAPLPVARADRPDPRGPMGILQAAARFSALARGPCPQVAGLIVDDFFKKYTPEGMPPPVPGRQAARIAISGDDDVARPDRPLRRRDGEVARGPGDTSGPALADHGGARRPDAGQQPLVIGARIEAAWRG